VVYEAFVAGTDFNGANITGRGNVRSEDEVPEDVGTVGGEREWLRSFKNEVGRPELPAIGERWWPRRCGGIAFRHAGRYPVPDEIDLGVSEPVLILKFPIARLRKPGRHVAALCDGCDLARVFTNVVVAEQGEGRGFAGPVA
jgi:hypothetical protein